MITNNFDDFRLWSLVFLCTDAIQKLRARELSNYGISPACAAVLWVLDNEGGSSTPTQLQKKLLREPNTISELVRRLEKQGLILRVKDLEKKNLLRLEMTAKGRTIYAKAKKRKSITKVMACLTDQERDQLYSAARKLLRTAVKLL